MNISSDPNAELFASDSESVHRGTGISSTTTATSPQGALPEGFDRKSIYRPHDSNRVLPTSQSTFIDLDEPDRWFSFSTFRKYAGPGWLMSLACMDPGNLEADLQLGAFTGFQLIWMVFLSHVFCLILQLVAARLGACSGKGLADVCKSEYPRWVSWGVHGMLEVAIIGADIQAILGISVALHVLLAIPMWAGVICALVDVATYYAIHHLRHTSTIIEVFIACVITIILICFFINLGVSAPSASNVFGGFVPNVEAHAVFPLIGVIGAVIMPHNMFLHSALVADRQVVNVDCERSLAQSKKYFSIDATVAMTVSFLVNLAIVASFAQGFFDDKCASGVAPHTDRSLGCVANSDLWSDSLCPPSDPACHCTSLTGDTGVCSDITLETAGTALGNFMSSGVSRILFAIGLLGAAEASSLTLTLTGQYVLKSFHNFSVRIYQRLLMTRSISFTFCLLVTTCASTDFANSISEWVNVLQAVMLPCAVLPLLHFAQSAKVMGGSSSAHVISPVIKVICILLASALICINSFFFVRTIIESGDVHWGIWLLFSIFAMVYCYVCAQFILDDIKSFSKRLTSCRGKA